MRFARIASSVCSTLLCGALAAAPSQDLYRTAGHWLDDSAQPYRLESLHGSYTVMTMAYGACRRVCATSLRVLQQVQALADERHLSLNFVVVGVDPDQDKPADWAEFRRDRQLTKSNWRFLSGDAASIGRLAQRLGVHYWRYGEHTMHDFRVVLLSPEGQLVRSIDAFDQSPTLLLP